MPRPSHARWPVQALLFAGMSGAASGCVWIGDAHHAEALDGDGDGRSVFEECDDADPGTMAGPGTWFTDADGDGFGAGAALQGCGGPGLVAVDGDCDDLDPRVNPDANEVCDPLNRDEDCDGASDDEDPQGAVGTTAWFVDADGDNVGAGSAGTSCDGGAGLARTDGDCDDGDAAVFPGAVERCDGLRDEDCDGEVDEDGALGALAWFIDADGDGYGDPFAWIQACEAPPGTADNGDDCDDSAPWIAPNAVERCDAAGIDEDCDGGANVEDPDADWAYRDLDGDGYGDPNVATEGCPIGFVLDASDCDDTDSSVRPGDGCPEVE